MLAKSLWFNEMVLRVVDLLSILKLYLIFAEKKLQSVRDTNRHKGMRRQLAMSLASKGIEDERILKAIATLPRHLFINSSFEWHAYEDKAFPIASGQTISQPYTVAFQTQLLQVEKGHKILEIGTGSGYQAAVLCLLGVELYTIERQNELFKKTQLFLPKLGIYPKRMIFGDGYKGLAQEAPFDRIIVTAGAPFIPKALMQQLAIGGRLVIPVGEKQQVMTLLERTSLTHFRKKEYGNCYFVPMLEDRN